MKTSSLYLFLFFFISTSFSQTPHWASTQLPGPFPMAYHHAIGKTCIIFVDDTSQAVHAFDINLGAWQTSLVPTESNWIRASADGNVAMVYNDSIIVGYSALTSTFSALAYTGILVALSGEEYGCIDNFAFFVTDQLFYVFDAEDAQWRSFAYTPPAFPVSGGGVRGKEDYIYLDLWITNSSPHTMAAYSSHTKTFAELTEPDLYEFTQLDHGYTFHRGPSATHDLCGGYSAFTGQFRVKTHSRTISENWPSVYQEQVSPMVCNLFTANEQVSGNDYRFYLWVFNTMIGDFAEYTFFYTYNGSHYVPVKSGSGGQTAYVVIRNVDLADKLELVAYSAATNSFSHFDTPLFYWGFMSFAAGGSVIDAFDEQTYFLYDVQTHASFSHPVQWTSGILPGVNARGLANYWSVFAYTEQYEDTVHVFSYNRPNGTMYAFDIAGRASNSVYRGGDLYGLLITELGTPVKTFLYSPIHNAWTERDLTSTSYRGAAGSYFYANYTGLGQTYFYDAQANQEHWLPSAQLPAHVLARDSMFLMYSNAGKYIGYSMNEHAVREYTVNRLTGQQWGEFVVLNLDMRYEFLLYDGDNNIFAPLTLTPLQGIRRISWPGGKTAFVASQNGYLFAYFPDDPSAVEDADAFNGPLRYSLSQNYPNPFNPTTTIGFSLPSQSFVSLKIFDVMGREVAVLLAEELPAGMYKQEWNAADLSSGVYFYRLEATTTSLGQSGSFTKTKKLLLLR